MSKYFVTAQALLSVAIAYVSDRLGILFSVLAVLLGMMVCDYITGMLASKKESIEHPDDPNYGWSSKKGAIGIMKKIGYIAVIVAAMTFDFLIINIAQTVGYNVPTSTFFGLLAAVWYILNELLSIIENAGRMGANVPDWLAKNIAAFKDHIDKED